MPGTLLVVGLGYTGTAIAKLAAHAGYTVFAATRTPPQAPPAAGVDLADFAHAGAALSHATHLVTTVPPDEAGDPVLRAHHLALRTAPHLRWLGYLSTTGVYGDRGGAWVDEATEPAPSTDRTHRRLAAEAAWADIAGSAAGRALDLFRLAGIYGPGRSALDDVRSGRARRIIKPGHAFGRIHRDDIAHAVLAAMAQNRPPGVRVLNLADDEPAETARVIEEAAHLLGVPPPPETPFAQAAATMSPMALSFWAENRKVANAATKAALGITWRYPTYREGLRAILAEEITHGGDQHIQVPPP